MTTPVYMPTGRTSLVNRGKTPLQIQTEYQYRPIPRITTTVLNAGQVIHKIERTLDKVVSSLEEQHKTEVAIKRQHAEVIAIVKSDSYQASAASAPAAAVTVRHLTTHERIAAIPGTQKVFRLNNDGTFEGSATSEQFKERFLDVFKNLRELMELFRRLPGIGITREKGVCEIQRDRLYFASSGSECYFVVVRRANAATDFEQEIKAALLEDVEEKPS